MIVLRLKEPFRTRLEDTLCKGVERQKRVGAKHTAKFCAVICNSETYSPKMLITINFFQGQNKSTINKEIAFQYK